MLADQFTTAVAGARSLAQLEDVSRLVWRAHAEQHLSDGDATAISEAVEARRARIKEPLPSARRRPPRSPNRQASIGRRRRQAASGAMPPALAARFTTGEAAALAVIAREVQRAGRCTLYVDAIAAMAGVCRSIVQNATREAARLGLLRVTERRIPGRKSLSNVVEVISPEWTAWLRIGFRKIGAPITDSKTTLRKALDDQPKGQGGAPSAHTALLGALFGTA